MTDPPEIARALKILLAEDNLMNQKLAPGFLRGMDTSSTIANNGREAVDAYQAERFDVILMDVQMPVMDGFAATAAIRELRTSQRHQDADRGDDSSCTQRRSGTLPCGRNG